MGLGSVDTMPFSGTPSSETAKIQSQGPLLFCWFSSFSGPPQCCCQMGVRGFGVLFSPYLLMQLGQSWKLASQHMVAPQHDILYLPSSPGSYVCPWMLFSWEGPCHPILIGCILFYDHSFTYVSSFPFLWHAGQFVSPISVFYAVIAQM